MGFWKNPEFLRHVRAHLRPSNALTGALVVWVIVALIGIIIWKIQRNFYSDFYFTLLTIQFAGGGLGVITACGRALVRERTFQTFDFWRTTRLTPGDLLVGMLLGVPVTVYFALVCSIPISLWAGFKAGFSLEAMFGTYLLFCAFIFFVGLMALLTSMLTDKAQGGLSFGTMGFMSAIVVLLFGVMPMVGWGAINPFYAIVGLHGMSLNFQLPNQIIFGYQISFLSASLILYASLGAWVVLMLIRNIKKSSEEIVLLSRWQVVAFTIFLNLLLYAFVDLKNWKAPFKGEGFLVLVLGFNSVLFYLAGLLSLTPYERLKVWWRDRTSGMGPYLSDEGPAWLFLGIAGLGAFGVLVGWLWLLPDSVAAELRGKSVSIVFSFLILLIFAIRDTLFLQWCRFTTWQRPIRAGFLYLALYYFSVSVLTAIEPLRFFAAYLSPICALGPWMSSGDWSDPSLHGANLVQGGVILLQVIVISFLQYLINVRLKRPGVHPAASVA